jgi:hypothetical protein
VSESGIFTHTRQSALAKKFVSATAVADYGDSQAIAVAPTGRRSGLLFVLGNVSLVNRSGGALACGLAVRFKTTAWAAGQVTAAGAYTADTTDAQDAESGDFPLHNRADSGSGFLVSADEPFDVLGLVLSAAGDQTTPVKILEYWNGASWVDIVASAVINNTLIGDGTGEKVLVWGLPPNWAVGGSGTGVPATRYNLRCRHTHSGAGSADPAASQLFVGRTVLMVPTLANNAVLSQAQEYGVRCPVSGDALFPVFATASAANEVMIGYRHDN